MLWKNLFSNDLLRQKFIEEANQYLYLEHTHIVGLSDFIIREDAYYLVMEYVDGQTLDDYIYKVSGPVPEEVAAAMMEEILDAIGYAHSKSVVHLDIKPSNIMINENGHIKVLDFGIATNENKLTGHGIMGSPMYMSPEQVIGKNIGKHSDIYSLGITFFQMLTASLPFASNVSRKELFEKITSEPIPALKTFVPWSSEKAQEIINRATSKKINERYNNCKEFSKSLKYLI